MIVYVLYRYGNAEKLQYQYCYCDTRCQFRYGNQENYSTGTVITTKDVSTGMVIHKITVPVLFWYGNPENYSTSTVIVMSDVSTGMAIRNITVPVLSSRHSKSIPVWSSSKISLPVMIYCYTNNVIKKLTLPVLYVVFRSNTHKVCFRVW